MHRIRNKQNCSSRNQSLTSFSAFSSSFLLLFGYRRRVYILRNPHSTSQSILSVFSFCLGRGGGGGERQVSMCQLISFLSLFSARLATLFCGSRTRACLKSAYTKRKEFYKRVEDCKTYINYLPMYTHKNE